MSHVICDEMTALVINDGFWLRIVKKLCRRQRSRIPAFSPRCQRPVNSPVPKKKKNAGCNQTQQIVFHNVPAEQLFVLTLSDLQESAPPTGRWEF